MINMGKAYESKEHEAEIYRLWEKSGFFNPDKLPGKPKKTYSISIPPPNVTGSLHLGHALNNTIQDILTRFYRMKGRKTLWLPGTDHAGIATQNVVEKELAKQGLTRHQLGREKFTEKAWQWKAKYGDLILEQLKKLGCSCDWSRTRFTLDKNYTEAVLTAFINYHKKGYIYRGPRIVNWCLRCTTAISDIEIKYQEKKGKLWYLKYPIKGDTNYELHTNDANHFIVVATTRPETMLGDTAVAVNPKDKRYKNLIGQKLILPIVNREIPIVSHRLVDVEFGTGAVKITPAHDKTDWQIGKENNLEVINVIGPEGKMTKEAGKYAGLPVLEARKKIVKELEKLNLLEKVEDYQHQISLCDRCGTPIEPQISTQWFVSMKKLAKPAIKVVKKSKIKISPERYKKIYLDWLDNIEDWCISRQLWWGHRLPVWFCQKEKDKYIVSVNQPKKCPYCNKCKMKQSEDVLDTWFSSALWPFATLGWPKKTKDLKEFYPTSLLSTARDILYLWVARMVFSGLEFLKKIPFEQVYIHSTILTLEGRRMSKSLGTGIDPLELINKYGADATRFGIIYQTNRDQQAIRFDERAIVAARNFINKLWNISRFIAIQIETEPKIKIKNIKTQTLADHWIISRANNLITSITKKIENYEFGEASKEIYEFVWHDFADWYLEISKFQIADPGLKKETIRNLKLILCLCLRLLHPFIPFVTEQIYQQLNTCTNSSDLLMIASWPKIKKNFINLKKEKEFASVKEMVMKIRNWKIEQKISPKEIVDYKIKTENKNLLRYAHQNLVVRSAHNKKILAQNELKDLIEKLGKVKLTL
ncbi:valine--tRNA ligase [Patescibacteria group bacterium]|nr:valine--tRNA ligase [Patescibacteria group bacterium]